MRATNISILSVFHAPILFFALPPIYPFAFLAYIQQFFLFISKIFLSAANTTSLSIIPVVVDYLSRRLKFYSTNASRSIALHLKLAFALNSHINGEFLSR